MEDWLNACLKNCQNHAYSTIVLLPTELLRCGTEEKTSLPLFGLCMENGKLLFVLQLIVRFSMGAKSWPGR